MRGFKEGVREIQSPLGDGNERHFCNDLSRLWLEKYSPRQGTETTRKKVAESKPGQRNTVPVRGRKLCPGGTCGQLLLVREIQSPLGDGNICISHTFRKNSLLEKYSPRQGTETCSIPFLFLVQLYSVREIQSPLGDGNLSCLSIYKLSIVSQRNTVPVRGRKQFFAANDTF